MLDQLRSLAYGFLRWTERYIKTDMVYVASGGFWLFFGQAMSATLVFVLAVAFANLVEPEKYGNYKYIMALTSIIGACTLTGLTTAVTRAVARGFEGTLKEAFKLTLVWSAGMLIVAGIGGAYYLFQENILLGYALLIMGAFLPIISAASVYRPFLVARKDFRRASLFGIVQSGIPTLAVLATLLIFSKSILLLVAVYFVSSAVVLYCLYLQTKKLTRNESTDPVTPTLGKHLSVMGLISAVSQKIDSILVFQLLGGAELAVFSLATTIPDTVRGSFKHIDALATPKFVQKTKGEMKKAVWSKMWLLFGISLLLALAYYIAAPYIFRFVFPQYLDAIPYTQLYAFIIPMSFALASSYFDAQAAVKERYILNIVNNATRVLFTVLGIVYLGIGGAIFGRLLSRVVNIVLSGFFIARH